ncbi:MAG TPA: polysaccharide biosynthesis/export family protein [Chryseosolibacter sp.]
MKVHLFFFFVVVSTLLCSCSSYKQNTMFRAGDNSKISQEKAIAESNYVIKKNDLLQLEVYTNQGDKIIDPNFESFKDSPNQSGLKVEPPKYLVDNNGVAKLPLLNEVKLEGLTVRAAEDLLQKEYAKQYQQPFVMLSVTNRRVTVLGAPGGKVIPLLDENVRLTEVLALAGGIGLEGKATNIRVLRGNQIFLANLSTLDGYLSDDMLIQSGDIIYVEQIRRPFLEALRSYGPVFSVLTSLAAVTVVIINSNRENSN